MIVLKKKNFAFQILKNLKNGSRWKFISAIKEKVQKLCQNALLQQNVCFYALLFFSILWNG
jgi:hypothetical protein